MIRRLVSPGLGTAIACGVVLALAIPLGAAGAAPPRDGIGDPYYPSSGNPGYDVSNYGLDLSYDPGSDVLAGEAVITASALTALTSFNLDLDGLTVSSITVDGVAAAFSRKGGELTVKPVRAITKGASFVVTAVYSGVPVSLDDAGFIATDDGVLVAGQPRVASSWFPANDHPADKATYTIDITVPAGLQAVSNGRLVSKTDEGDSSVWRWQTDEPMASYLATIDIGEFDLHEYTDADIDYVDAVDPDLLVYTAHSGDTFASSGAAFDSYNRLARTITVDPASPRLSFWVNRAVEQGYDFAIVEVAPTGSAAWTTLRDEGGILTQDTPTPFCDAVLSANPFLGHYLSKATDEAPCAPTGTTGQWWAATGSSDGWEQWTFDLTAYAGSDVDVALTYVSDYDIGLDGVYVDDIVAPGGVGSTSFEDDGDTFDGWSQDWSIVAAGGPSPLGLRIQASLARQPEIIAALSSWFGPYPFGQAGAIVDDHAGLGFALENQTRPVYAKEFWERGLGDVVVVHELAHQWYGDSVAVQRWSDIWLNEGFATYAEWLWSDYEDPGKAQSTFDFYYNEAWSPRDPFWKLKIGDPGTAGLFSNPVYYRGAMTLHALRLTIGDDAFFELLPLWHAQHVGGNGTTAEFIALAQTVSGKNLKSFFDAWLYTGKRPAAPPAATARAFAVQLPPKLPVEAPRY